MIWGWTLSVHVGFYKSKKIKRIGLLYSKSAENRVITWESPFKNHQPRYIKEKHSVTGILSWNNFHYSLYDYQAEYYYPCCYEILDIPEVAGLDKARLYKLYNHEETHKTKDKEDLKIDPLCEDQAGSDQGKPCGKRDNGQLLFSHPDSCRIVNIIVPQLLVLVPEPGHRIGPDWNSATCQMGLRPWERDYTMVLTCSDQQTGGLLFAYLERISGSIVPFNLISSGRLPCFKSEGLFSVTFWLDFFRLFPLLNRKEMRYRQHWFRPIHYITDQ